MSFGLLFDLFWACELKEQIMATGEEEATNRKPGVPSLFVLTWGLKKKSQAEGKTIALRDGTKRGMSWPTEARPKAQKLRSLLVGLDWCGQKEKRA